MESHLPFDVPVPPPASPVAKARALAQVEAHADHDWLTVAYRALVAVAGQQATLTTDDVWTELRRQGAAVSTHDLRAIGPVLRRASKDGVLVATDRVRLSVIGRGRWKTRVWRSTRYQGVA